MYQSNTMLSAPFNTMKISAATDMTKSLKPKKKQGRIFTEMNNLYGLNSLRQGKKTLIGY
tara:strand:- start:3759 stop:3938 length:180 start_codon:yes stop_codon:yes gene_type:complete